MTLEEALRELEQVSKDRAWYRLRVQQLEASRVPTEVKEHLLKMSETLKFVAERIQNRLTPHLLEDAKNCERLAKY